jgi:hypothetical protein
MRILCAMVAILLLLPAAVCADSILLFAEPTIDICAKDATPFSVTSVYIMHAFTAGSTASAFMINDTSGLVRLGSSCSGLSVDGSTPYDGVYIQYGSCVTGTFAICRLDFFNATGQPVPGCYQLTVENHPFEDAVLAYDCSGTPMNVGSGAFFTFDIGGKPCFDCDIAVEETTWGAVKALYR